MGDSATGGALDVTGNNGATTTDGTNGAITTNAQWSQQAVELLSEAGYDATTVYAALGAFLAGQSLTPDQATIARAALAAAGQPPVGGPFTVREQAATQTNLPAPTGLKSDSQTSSTVHLTWSAVTGAAGYDIYRSDTGSTVVGVGTSNSGSVAGLEPNKSYTFTVAARGANGVVGARSSSTTAKTKAVSLTAPTGVKATVIGTTTITMACNPVPGATRYGWYVGGIAHGSSDAPTYQIQGLRSKTSYKISVAADNETQAPGKQSAAITVKTK
jgi:hypothetical protein